MSQYDDKSTVISNVRTDALKRFNVRTTKNRRKGWRQTTAFVREWTANIISHEYCRKTCDDGHPKQRLVLSGGAERVVHVLPCTDSKRVGYATSTRVHRLIAEVLSKCPDPVCSNSVHIGRSTQKNTSSTPYDTIRYDTISLRKYLMCGQKTDGYPAIVYHMRSETKNKIKAPWSGWVKSPAKRRGRYSKFRFLEVLPRDP